MYSGTTLTKYSGRILGAHQRLDRIARSHLKKIIPAGVYFPEINHILQFEGKNGPDGIKRKSPARDEPFHFYSPFDDNDSKLIELIRLHYKQLVRELRLDNQERAAFEAAWLAHAIADGLTPAHHYPYEEKLSELRGGVENTLNTLKHKLVLPGINRRSRIRNNWKMWGPKGLFTAHGLFEMGIATIFMPLSFKEAIPKEEDINLLKKIGPLEWFKRSAREIAVLDMFDRYYKTGWTPRLAWLVRHKLGPTITQTITLVWLSAALEAQKANK